jgi:F-type H+-transporting ATPase subunit b
VVGGIMNRRKILASLALGAVLLLLSYGFALAVGEPEGAARSGDLLDLLYRFMNFALLVIILVVVWKKVRIGDFFRSRSQEIQKRLDELRKGKEEAEKKLHDIEQKLKEFEKNKQQMLRQFEEEGLEEKQRILAAANERARQIIEQAETSIQQEINTARDRLQRQIVALAAQRAMDILSKEITGNDQDRLVEEFIEKVRKAH